MAHFRSISGVGYIYAIHSYTFGGNNSNVNAGMFIRKIYHYCLYSKIFPRKQQNFLKILYIFLLIWFTELLNLV